MNDKSEVQKIVHMAQELGGALEGQQRELKEEIESAAGERERKETRVRNFVTFCFTWLFVAAVFIALAVPILNFYWPAADDSDRLIKHIMSVLQGPVLSVLNLVLGYYFGAASRSGRPSP